MDSNNDQNIMFGLILGVIVGIFIWKYLPLLIFQKKKFKIHTTKYYLVLLFKILGFIIIILSILDFIFSFFDNKYT